MPRQNWKKVYPNSLHHAMSLCTQFAKDKKNLSVERIAELIGTNASVLYKWMSDARMPAHMIRPFEHVCGIDLVTKYLGHSANHLVLPIPTGRRTKHRDINELSAFSSETMNLLFQHQDGNATAEETIAGITLLMEGLAFQRGNIEKEVQPELPL